MCSESNHLSPNDFFSLLAYGILRIYTAYCQMNHHPRMQFHQKVSLASVDNKDEMLLYSVYTGQTMGSTLLKHQRTGSPKEILHACNGIPCPKHYTPIRKFETIFMSRLVMHCTSFLIVIYALQVLRYTTIMQKKKHFSSNRWDAPADIMMAEYRLEVLQEYSREKRAYTKRDSGYWHEGGIEALRAKRREAVQRPAILEG